LWRYSFTLGSSDQAFEDTDGGNTQSPYDAGFFFTEAVAAQVSLLQLMYVKDSRFLIVFGCSSTWFLHIFFSCSFVTQFDHWFK
jgi:hypothetical protein